MTFRTIATALISLMLLAAGPLAAQDESTMETPLSSAPAGVASPVEGQGGSGPRAQTGGAQTLEDILARQKGQKVDESFRRDAIGNPDGGQPITSQLGTLGGMSDAEVFRALRYGEANVKVQSPGIANDVIIQDSGMWWLRFREGPLAHYGSYALLGTLGLLALFYLIRGRVRIESGKSGITILRFNFIERFAHWLTAGSFVLLALTGLFTLLGRQFIIPWLGRPLYADIAAGSKWVHNNVSWAFMLGLVLIFVFWVLDNIPNRYDLKWMAKAGGLFSKHSHPPAKKFNAGQKLIFWSVIVFGASISVSGLSLLFPFELHMFAPTFAKLNDLGVPALLGMDPFPTQLTPHQEMQYAELWHAIVGFALMAIILAHIYIGSIGMEGAFDAMGSGEVDRNWAQEHHNLWVEEVEAKSAARAGTTPAE